MPLTTLIKGERSQVLLRPPDRLPRLRGEMGVNPEKNPVDVTIAVWRWGTYLGEEALTRTASG